MEINSRKNSNKKKSSVDLSTMVYGKIPPQDIELEKAILGAMMLEREAIPFVLELIKTSEVFYKDDHKYVFEAILSLYDKRISIDILTVVDELKKTEKLDLVGGPFAVTKITNDVVSSAHIEDHCKLILELFLKRELIKISGSAIGSAYEDDTDVFELYNRIDNNLINTRETAEVGMSKDIRHYAASVSSEYTRTKEVGVLGLQTKIQEYDRVFCGLVAPDFIVIAARPGAGKTAFILSVINNICIKDQVPVGVFSLEMDGSQLVRRLASIDSGIDHSLIRNAKVPDDKLQYFYNALDRIQASPLYIDDRVGLTIRDLRTKAFILKRKHNIKVIFIDYLQLMSGSGNTGGNREQDISQISRGIKSLAKEISIPIIALSQLSRAVESRPDKMPILSDLRESGSIEQDADSVMFLMRPEYYGFTEPVEISGVLYDVKGLAIAKSGKNRHGPTENFAMTFDGPTMHFKNRESPSSNFSGGFREFTPPSATQEDLPF